MRVLHTILLCLTGISAWAQNVATTDEITDPQEAYGLHLLSDPAAASIDIVAVHGMDGHWRRSWTADNGVFWLQDLLPSMLLEARIFSFGYDSRTRGANTPLTLDISDHGKDLVSSLVNKRRLSNTEERPLIFIGHSLGGLVVKAALFHSDMARVGHLERQKSIKLCTYAVLFFGTPHQGGQGVSLMKIMTRILSVTSYTNDKLIDQISPHSDILQALQERYNPISQDFETVFFYETHEMSLPLPAGKLLVVPRFSAVIPGAVNAEDVSLSADHSTMVKYTGLGDPNFEKVVQRLQVLSMDSAPRIKQNLERWSESRKNEQWRMLPEMERRETRESRGPRDVDSLTDTEEFQLGLLVQQIRNRYFVGRDGSLQQMRRILQASATDQGDGAFRLVVLHGLGGAGKTQLALEYAYSSGSHYSAVFWIDCSSYEMAVFSIHRHLRRILEHCVSLGLGGDEHPRYQQIQRALAEAEMAYNATKSPHSEPNVFKKTTKKPKADEDGHRILLDAFIHWLSHGKNSHWLLVLDNLDDLESFDFRTLLPRVPWGDVVVTTRRSDLAIWWDAIEVGNMNEEEAMQLLMTSAMMTLRPGSTDWDDGKLLVDRLGYFPLAIVQAGSLLAVQRPPNPVAFYMNLLQGFPLTALGHRNTQLAWDYRNETVLTTWEISFEAVRKQMPRAAHILQICAFLNREEIKEDIFVLGMPLQKRRPDDDIQVQESFSLLMTYSLVHRTADASGFTLHPVIHKWARLRLDSKDQTEFALETLRMLERYWRSGGLSGNIIRPHTLELLSFYETECPCDPADILVNEGLPRKSGQLTRMETLMSMSKATWYWMYGHWDTAKSFLCKLLTADAVACEPVWELLTGLSFLLGIHEQTIRGRGLAGCQAAIAFGSGWHPRALYALEKYAYSLRIAGDHALSSVWYNWLLDTRARVLGKEHPETTGALMGLARSAQTCTNATEWAVKAYDTRLRQFGPDHYLTKFALRAVKDVVNDCVDKRTEDYLPWLTDYIERRKGVLSMAWDEVAGWLCPRGRLRLAAACLNADSHYHNEGALLLAHFVRHMGHCEQQPCYNCWWPPESVNLIGFFLIVIDKHIAILSQSPHTSELVASLEKRWHDLAVDSHPQFSSEQVAFLEHRWDDLDFDFEEQNWHFFAVESHRQPSTPSVRDGRFCGRMSIALTIVLIHIWQDNLSGVSLWFKRWQADILMTPRWYNSGKCLYDTSKYTIPIPNTYLLTVLNDKLYYGGPWQDQSVVSAIMNFMLNPLLLRHATLSAEILLSGEDVVLCPSRLRQQHRDLIHLAWNQSPRWGNALTVFTQEAMELHVDDQTVSCFADFRRTYMCRA